MPIRTGSGGLKYPLPSQSQVGASQAAASASAGGSASASAFGTRMGLIAQGRKLRYDAMQSEMDREFRAEQNFYDREHQMGAQLESQGFRAGLQQEQLRQQRYLHESDQQFRVGQAQLDRDFQGQQAQLGRDFQTGRDKQLNQYDQDKFERGVDARIEEGIRTGQIELPLASMQKLQKLEADKASFKGTPDQQAEFQMKYEAEKRRLLRDARRAPSMAGEVNRNTVHYDPKTGKTYDQPIEGVTQPRLVGQDGLGPIDQVGEAEKAAKALQAQKQEQAQAKQQQEFKKEQKDWQNRIAAEAARMAKEHNAANEDDIKQPSDFTKDARDEVIRQGFTEPQAPVAPAAPVAANPAPPRAQQPPPVQQQPVAPQAPQQQGMQVSPAEQAYLDDIQKQSPNAPLSDQEKAQFIQFYRRKNGIPAQPANVVPPPPQPGIPAQPAGAQVNIPPVPPGPPVSQPSLPQREYGGPAPAAPPQQQKPRTLPPGTMTTAPQGAYAIDPSTGLPNALPSPADFDQQVKQAKSGTYLTGPDGKRYRVK